MTDVKRFDLSCTNDKETINYDLKNKRPVYVCNNDDDA